MSEDQQSEIAPGLQNRLELSEEQVGGTRDVLARLSQGLDSLPVILSQDGDVVSFGGPIEAETAERLARLASRIWQEGATRPSRELIRFEEEAIGEESSGRANLMLYSAHVVGALTLTVGWEIAISLTQVRAEVADARRQLMSLFAE
jgi:hypothetical protein